MTVNENRIYKELRILNAIFADDTFLESFETDWNFIYNRVKEDGWLALTDLEVDLIYHWWFE